MTSEEESLPLAVARRILQLKLPGENDADFGRRIGLAPQVLSNYRSRLHGASLDAVSTVAKRAGVRFEWLFTGEGPRDLHAPSANGYTERVEGVRETTERLYAIIAALRSEFGLPSDVAPLSSPPEEEGERPG